MPGTTSNGERLLQNQTALKASSSSKVFIKPVDSSKSITTKTTTLSSDSGGETDNSSGDESGHEKEREDAFDTHYSPQITRLRPVIPDSSLPSHPRISRAFSLPLPSQLGYLQHPHRASSGPFSDPPTPESSHLRELSLELADSVQMAIQTMLQISPSQVLDPAKESFSACSLAVPTSSMSAMLTAMKNLNYISANMSAFCANPSDSVEEDKLFSMHWGEFDIGELVQSAGDAMGGVAAQVGVELVLYHGDVGLKHVWVKGDESGLSYLLAHVCDFSDLLQCLF
jgi:osomolarity two-component system, response regulator SSK1